MKRVLVPYLRHFPIWRLMMVNNTDYEWRPDWFGAWEYRTDDGVEWYEA